MIVELYASQNILFVPFKIYNIIKCLAIYFVINFDFMW